MGRIALCGLMLLMTSGCITNLPRETVAIAADGPVVDESLPARQTGRGTDPTRELARSMAQSAAWRRGGPVDFGALDRPTGNPRRDAATATTGVEMRAAPPAASQAQPHDAVSVLDQLERRARSAAHGICEHC